VSALGIERLDESSSLRRRFLAFSYVFIVAISPGLVAWVFQTHERRHGMRPIWALVGVSVAIQLASTVFWYQLEETQVRSLQAPISAVVLRLLNIVALALGEFVVWGLRIPLLSDRMLTPNYLSFLARNEARHFSTFLIVVWFGIVCYALAKLLEPLLAQRWKVGLAQGAR
jgi:hypothetical protein